METTAKYAEVDKLASLPMIFRPNMLVNDEGEFNYGP